MDLESLSKDDWIIGGIAVLLVIDLLFLPWLRISAGHITLTSTATGTPDGWLGVLAMLAVLALIADLSLERFSPRTQLPAVDGSRTQTRFLMACVAAGLLALKFLFHVHVSRFGVGFWGALVLSAALVYVALKAHNAERAVGRA